MYEILIYCIIYNIIDVYNINLLYFILYRYICNINLLYYILYLIWTYKI